MTVEEAYAEMKRRGWGFVRQNLSGMIAIGPIENPDYEDSGQPPIIQVLAMGVDPVEVFQRAIERWDHEHSVK